LGSGWLWPGLRKSQLVSFPGGFGKDTEDTCERSSRNDI
jgi:hypothetical protein